MCCDRLCWQHAGAVCELLARGITLPGSREQQGTVHTTKAFCCGAALQLCMGETVARRTRRKDLMSWPGARGCPDPLRPALTRLLPAHRVVVVFILPAWHHQLELIDIDSGVLDPVLQLRTRPSEHRQTNSCNSQCEREKEKLLKPLALTSWSLHALDELLLGHVLCLKRRDSNNNNKPSSELKIHSRKVLGSAHPARGTQQVMSIQNTCQDSRQQGL